VLLSIYQATVSWHRTILKLDGHSSSLAEVGCMSSVSSSRDNLHIFAMTLSEELCHSCIALSALNRRIHSHHL
jgi:hypothetical protein